MYTERLKGSWPVPEQKHHFWNIPFHSWNCSRMRQTGEQALMQHGLSLPPSQAVWVKYTNKMIWEIGRYVIISVRVAIGRKSLLQIALQAYFSTWTHKKAEIMKHSLQRPYAIWIHEFSRDEDFHVPQAISKIKLWYFKGCLQDYTPFSPVDCEMGLHFDFVLKCLKN